MAITINKIEDAFFLLYKNFHDKNFTKSISLKHKTESQLLPLVRTALLGFFKQVIPERQIHTPWTKSKHSYIDFCVDKTAIEFAVRNPGKSKSNITPNTNKPEIKKLLKWNSGPAVLVLFDFSDTPLDGDAIEQYRVHPSLGKGNHKKSPFTILYFYTEAHQGQKFQFCIRKNIQRISK